MTKRIFSLEYGAVMGYILRVGFNGPAAGKSADATSLQFEVHRREQGLAKTLATV